MSLPAEESSAPTGALAGAAYAAIAFGALGLLAPVFVLGSRGLTQLMNRVTANPALLRIDEILWTGTYGTWTRASLGIAFALSALLLVTGLGLRKKRRWAGQLGLLYVVFQALLMLANAVLAWTVLMPALGALRDELGADPAARASIAGAIPGALVGNLFNVVFLVVLAALLRRPSVRAELR